MAAEKTIRHNMAQNFVFPSDFLWGASTSAFQIEGGYDQGGRGPATTDRERPHIASARTASDHYHHWQQVSNRLLRCITLNVRRLLWMHSGAGRAEG